MKKFLNDERGDSNFVSIIAILILLIVAVVLFKPYVLEFVLWLHSVFV